MRAYLNRVERLGVKIKDATTEREYRTVDGQSSHILLLEETWSDVSRASTLLRLILAAWMTVIFAVTYSPELAPNRPWGL